MAAPYEYDFPHQPAEMWIAIVAGTVVLLMMILVRRYDPRPAARLWMLIFGPVCAVLAFSDAACMHSAVSAAVRCVESKCYDVIRGTVTLSRNVIRTGNVEETLAVGGRRFELHTSRTTVCFEDNDQVLQTGQHVELWDDNGCILRLVIDTSGAGAE